MRVVRRKRVREDRVSPTASRSGRQSHTARNNLAVRLFENIAPRYLLRRIRQHTTKDYCQFLLSAHRFETSGWDANGALSTSVTI